MSGHSGIGGVSCILHTPLLLLVDLVIWYGLEPPTRDASYVQNDNVYADSSLKQES